MNKKVLRVQNNDIYFLEKVADMIVSNANYKGILVYNNQLEKIAHINLLENLMIYQAYKNENEYQILLDCPDNKCIAFVNLLTSEYRIISTGMYEKLIFSPLYYWEDARIYLSTYKGEFYCIDLDGESLSKVNLSDKIDKYRMLKTEFEKQNCSIYKIYSIEKQILVNKSEQDSEKYELWNYREKVVKVAECKLKSNYHDIEMSNNCIVKVGEEKVEILFGNTKMKLYPPCGFTYRNGKIMFIQGKIYIFLLCNDESNLLNNLIERYEF